MTDLALDATADSGVSSQVNFLLADVLETDFDDAFDVIWSRDALMHVHDKKRLFAKLYSLLEDGGQLVITDYARGPKPGTPEFEAYAKSTGYHLVEPGRLRQVPRRRRVPDVIVEDATAKFTQILKDEPVKLAANREDFLSSFSETDLNYLVDRWAMKVRFCDAGDMKCGHLQGDQEGLISRPGCHAHEVVGMTPNVLRLRVGSRKGLIVKHEQPIAASDESDLSRFGYSQSLGRSLGGFSSFAAGFAYISILTGLFQMVPLGYRAAGPAFFWTWPVVALGQMSVALCFAELAGQYPLCGSVYQWAKNVGNEGWGWIAGWVSLAGSIAALAAVAMALQAALPAISPAFQFVGDASEPVDASRNAVILACVLIALTTALNARGVTLMAAFNNVEWSPRSSARCS